MSVPLADAIFDCNIFAQALINPVGPSGRCLRLAREGVIALYISQPVVVEIRELYEKLPSKYGVTAADTDDLCRNVATFATLVTHVEDVYRHPIDPDDSHYVNLAVQVNALNIVSRDRHLLNLMDPKRDESQEFRTRFPRLRVLDPVELLKELEKNAGGTGAS